MFVLLFVSFSWFVVVLFCVSFFWRSSSFLWLFVFVFGPFLSLSLLTSQLALFLLVVLGFVLFFFHFCIFGWSVCFFSFSVCPLFLCLGWFLSFCFVCHSSDAPPPFFDSVFLSFFLSVFWIVHMLCFFFFFFFFQYFSLLICLSIL